MCTTTREPQTATDGFVCAAARARVTHPISIQHRFPSISTFRPLLAPVCSRTKGPLTGQDGGKNKPQPQKGMMDPDFQATFTEKIARSFFPLAPGDLPENDLHTRCSRNCPELEAQRAPAPTSQLAPSHRHRSLDLPTSMGRRASIAHRSRISHQISERWRSSIFTLSI